jgi:hypothetical protein
MRAVLIDCITKASLDLILPLTQPACQTLYKQRLDVLQKLEATSLEVRHSEMEVRPISHLHPAIGTRKMFSANSELAKHEPPCTKK